MLPGELIIFMAIVESGQLEKQMDALKPITNEFMNNLYNSMVKHGYLTGNSYDGYKVTVKGKAAITEFLRGYSAIIKDKIGFLKQSDIGIADQEKGEVNKEPIGGNQRMSSACQDANPQQAVVLSDKGQLVR